MKEDDELKPVFTSKPPIPEKLAEMISCNCQSGVVSNAVVEELAMNVWFSVRIAMVLIV